MKPRLGGLTETPRSYDFKEEHKTIYGWFTAWLVYCMVGLPGWLNTELNIRLKKTITHFFWYYLAGILVPASTHS